MTSTWLRPTLPTYIVPDAGNVDCALHGHDWSAVGVYIGGVVHIPCKRAGCTAALVQQPDGTGTARPGVFDMAVGDTYLDMEDDPQGGVIKIVCYEVAHSYRLPDIPFAAGDVAVDIGAHVGGVSVYLGKKHPSARIYAFEPSSANYARLRRNLKANKVKNVTAAHVAVTGDGRDVTLELAIASGGHSILKPPSGDGERVNSLTLERIFDLYGIERLHLLKIDCEGAEYEILEVAEYLLDRVDWFVGEFHQSDMLTAQGQTPDGLAALVWRHIPKERTRINGSIMV